ncbi:MAG: glycosyltransferase [Anaerolineae bacterium]|nr:MAG: glycosyltransferase [Anaerolineae bacterium]
MKRLRRLGILANEFFDERFSRMGGFGWAVSECIRYFQMRPEMGVEVVLVTGENDGFHSQLPDKVHGANFIPPSENSLSYRKRLRENQIDLILSIDYRPNYRKPLLLLPNTPLIVWARDPRIPNDAERIREIRLPGEPNRTPQGLETPDCRSLATLFGLSKITGRKAIVAATCDEIGEKARIAYGMPKERWSNLPNIIELPTKPSKKAKRPMFLFLGRLDPYKRPWLFVELARRLPMFDFVMAGKNHFSGPGSWQLEGLPDNLRVTGHIQREEKAQLLNEAWGLINTSVHEGLAVSFLESLAHETPLVAGVNPESVVSRFGVQVESSSGDGMEGITGYVSALQELVEDSGMRTDQGRRGREWVSETHNAVNFTRSFNALCAQASIELEHARE